MIAVICAISLGACASLPANIDRTESHAYEDTRETALGRAYDRKSEGHTGESAFYLLGNPLDAFVARAGLAAMAERSIDTQYYMIHNDVVGGLFIDSLYKAAERGVRRMLHVSLSTKKELGGSPSRCLRLTFRQSAWITRACIHAKCP